MKNFSQKFSLSLLLLMTTVLSVFAQNTFLFEDFESGGLSQNGWAQEPANAAVPWSVGSSGVGTISPYAGTKMGKLFSVSYQSPVKLITPVINLTNVTEPYISFYVSSQRFNIGIRDTLKLYYKEYPNGNWTIMRIYSQTTDTWVQHTLRIKDFSQVSNLQFAFEYCYANGKGLALDNIKIYSNSVCFPPADFNVENIATTTATLRWTASSYSQANEVKVSTTAIPTTNLNTTQGDTYNGNTPLSILPLTGLAANTVYYAYVRSHCGGTDFSTWSAVTFKTRCYPIPEANVSDAVESFEAFPNNGYPDCWLRTRTLIGNWTDIAVGVTDYLPFVQTATAKTGTKSLKVSGLYDVSIPQYPRFAKSYAISQGLNVQNINQYYVSFWARSDSSLNKLHVGLLTDPDDVNTYQEAKIVSVEKAGVWEKINVYFNNITNNGKYIVFMANGQDDNRANEFFIDDIQVLKIPACPSADKFKMISISRQGITFSATFSWQSLYTNQPFDIHFYNQASDPVTATPVKQALNVLSPTTVSGFATLTTYYAYIKNHCANVWEGPVIFTTPLAPVPVPYSDGFETTEPWILENGMQANKWIVGSARPYKGTKSLYISQNNGVNNLYSPTSTSRSYAYKKFEFNAGQKVEISFYWRNWGNNDNAFLQAYLVQDNSPNQPKFGAQPHESWIKLTPNPLVRDTVWSQYIINSDIPSTGIYSLVFYWDNTSSVNTINFNPPAAIDNFDIRYLRCKTAENLKVEDVTPNTAKVTWTVPSGGATQWLLWCRPIATPDTTGIAPIVVNNVNSYQLTGLTEFAYYRVYVVANCGATNGKSYAKILNFQTHQNIETLPYTETFEGTHTMRFENGTQRNKWHVGTADKAGTTGTKSMYISDNNGASRRYITSGSPDPTSYVYAYKTFQLANNEVYSCSFNYKSYGENNKDIINVFVVPDYIHEEAIYAGNSNGMANDNNTPPAEWIRVGNGPVFNSTAINEWKNFTSSFAVPISGRYKLVFMWKNNNSGGIQPGAGAIDNLKVEQLVCSAPYNINVNIAATNAAVVTWLASSNSTSWDVSWGRDTNNLSAPVNVTTPSFTTPIPLLSEVLYYFRIKTNCNGGLNGTKTFKYTATTQFPYFTGFETDADTLWRVTSTGGTSNKWVIGSDRNAVRSGVKSLYIAKATAYTDYGYAHRSSSTYAYKPFTMKQGTRYKLSFYWKAKGEGTYSLWDYMRVFLVPFSDKASLANGNIPNGLTGTNTPPNWIDIGGGAKLNNIAWKKENIDFVSTVDGPYLLVFFWKNDGSGGDQPPAAVDDIAFYPFNCEMVNGINVSNISINGATITWRSNNVPSYDVKVSTREINPEYELADVLTDNVTDTTISLNGSLTAGTTYYVYVRANCSATNHSYYNVIPVIFGTICNPISIPYSINFNSTNMGVMPTCWVSAVLTEDAFTGNYTPFVDRRQDIIDPTQRYLRFDTYFDEAIGSTKSFAIFPKFNTPLNQMQISFDAIGSPTGKLSLASMTSLDPADASNLRVFDLLPTGKHHMIVLDGVAADAEYIAFLAKGDENGIGTLGVDNVKIEPASMCLPASDINHKNITTNSAELFWVSPYFGIQTWQIVVTTVDISSNMAQLATLPAAQVAYNQNVNANSVVIQNLTSGTKYFYYIRKACDGNTFSPWFNETRFFVTDCLPAQKCNVEFIKKSTFGGGWGTDTKLEVKIGNTVLNTLTFTNSAYSESQTLQLCPNVYNFKFTKTSNTNSVYFRIVVNGDTVLYANPNNNSEDNYIAELLSNCQMFICNGVSNINTTSTINSITATWTGTANSYKARLYKGNIQESAMMLSTPLEEKNVNVTNATFNGLTSNTQYTIFIKSLCSNTQTSIESHWVRLSVGTLIDIPTETLPINTNFENATDNNKWLLYSNDTPNKWAIGTATNKGTGTMSLYISRNRGTNNVYAVDTASYAYATRYISLIGGKDYHVNFDWKGAGEANKDLLRVFLIPGSYGGITDGNDFGMSESNNTQPADWIDIAGKHLRGLNSTLWASVDTIIHVNNTGNYFLAFFWKNDQSIGTQPPAAVDNVEIYEELCAQPVNITIGSITQTTAVATWTGSANNYDVKVYKYVTTIIDPNTTAPLLQSLAQTALTYNMTGLLANTKYIIYVRSNCVGGTHSGWKKVEFSTDFNIDNTPLNTTFENDADNAKWVIASSGNKNVWNFGTATNNGAGTKSMYISSNGGASNSYDIASTAISYSFRPLNLKGTATYRISFNWKCNGELNSDLGRAFLIPASYKQSIMNGDNNNMGGSNNNQPDGWIDLGGMEAVNMLVSKTGWQNVAKEFNIPSSGVYYLTFFWKNDYSAGSQPPIAIDNLVFDSILCPTPKNFSAVTTSSTATVTWTSTANSFEVKLYNNEGITPVLISTQTVSTPSVSYTGLMVTNRYSVVVKANCGNGAFANEIEYPFLAVNSIDPLPINGDMESAVDNFQWKFSTNKSGANKWYIGSAVKKSGTKAMYISYVSSGAVNSYNTGVISYSYAYRKVNLNKDTTYGYAFDWKSDGEGNYDLLRAFAIPDGADITDGNPNGMTYTNNSEPSGWIDLNNKPGGGKLQSSTSAWKRVEGLNFKVPTTGNYYIAFFWKNDGSGGDQPPAAIDNFVLSTIKENTIIDTVCLGYDYEKNGYVIKKDSINFLGTYNFFKLNIDPVTGQITKLTLKLTVIPGTENVMTRTVCKGDTIRFFGRVITAQTTQRYNHYTIGLNGCDSIIVLDLKVLESYNIIKDTVVNNCNLPLTINGKLFEINYPSGTWIVTTKHKTTIGNCDSIVTYSITIEGNCNKLSMVEAKQMKFTPNPIKVGEQLNITGNFTHEELYGLKIEVITSAGEMISSTKPTGMPIQIGGFNVSGVYIVRITTGKGDVIYGKIIVK